MPGNGRHVRICRPNGPAVHHHKPKHQRQPLILAFELSHDNLICLVAELLVLERD